VIHARPQTQKAKICFFPNKSQKSILVARKLLCQNRLFPCLPFLDIGHHNLHEISKEGIVTAAISAKAVPLYSPLSRESSLMSTYSPLICGEGAVVTTYYPKSKKGEIDRRS
jgi:hypothetical protein